MNKLFGLLWVLVLASVLFGTCIRRHGAARARAALDSAQTAQRAMTKRRSAAAQAGRPAQPTSGPDAIVGRWRGYVRCSVGADCSAGTVVITFSPGLSADIEINGKPDPTMPLQFTYSDQGPNERSPVWQGDFYQSQGAHVRWDLRRQGAVVFGELLQLPTLRINRTMTLSPDTT